MSRVQVTLEGERVGLFTMDPGRTTGVTESMPLLEGSVQEIFARDPLNVYHIDCEDPEVVPQKAELEGATLLYDAYTDFAFRCNVEHGIRKDRLFLVAEDFVLRSGHNHNSDRAGLSPVRVIYLLMGMLVEQPVQWVFQQPSTAKSTITDDRLRRWGLWTRGKVHGRDATRHACLWVRQALS